MVFKKLRKTMGRRKAGKDAPAAAEAVQKNDSIDEDFPQDETLAAAESREEAPVPVKEADNEPASETAEASEESDEQERATPDNLEQEAQEDTYIGCCGINCN
ncbi:predicted protein [Phaeodactylum tricornutum CCAP 1055/1]|uniref:Uncharacterized protein n=1 Tax=Phaeodactylum tricornutum (strain CCAP 1055/1) TaxID=556484 RepID=B7G2U3_PHATC|nr:predicted protein [Phaeodactylum tricornutum CCAP 1055/1]EEC47367.1 predicted protein [Phaeodactylum tricornutum CCAP 1055/1]|eukprot:XP_002181444.1 predicted protein [Phaeodactylum tricornutum CCAP 1055/1]